MVNIEKIDKFEWKVSDGKMSGRVFASEEFVEKIKEDKSLKQVLNVALLDGVVESIAMPDIHQGYGFPIGGVAAFDLEKGVVSPGGIGYDINCSVRLLGTNLKIDDVKGREEKITKALFESIPSGVACKGIRLDNKKINEVLEQGIDWAIENGYGKPEDKKFIEESGRMGNVNVKDITDKAKGRGINQLGTLGAGNHFLDLLVVNEIFDENVAEVFGLEKGQIVCMIHCGSRGLGHQVASDYIKLMEKEYGISGIDRDLVSAPINSELGQKYLSAMRGASNFAFANKQVITHLFREEMKKIFPDFSAEVVYEVCHNIAKLEKVDDKEVLVLRKGATRSLGPGDERIVEDYRNVGQPVLLPGSMGTSSYVLVGTRESEKKSFSSAPHGAGRSKSRIDANKFISSEDAKNEMKARGVFIRAGSEKSLVEEYFESYKDIDEVVRISEESGLARRVAKLRPLIVILG